MCERERGREGVCVCMTESEGVCVCVCVYISVHVCVYMCAQYRVIDRLIECTKIE